MSQFESFEEVFAREQLHFAAQDGDVEKVSQLLNEGYQPNLFDELGKTPLGTTRLNADTSTLCDY